MESFFKTLSNLTENVSIGESGHFFWSKFWSFSIWKVNTKWDYCRFKITTQVTSQGCSATTGWTACSCLSGRGRLWFMISYFLAEVGSVFDLTLRISHRLQFLFQVRSTAPIWTKSKERKWSQTQMLLHCLIKLFNPVHCKSDITIRPLYYSVPINLYKQTNWNKKKEIKIFCRENVSRLKLPLRMRWPKKRRSHHRDHKAG